VTDTRKPLDLILAHKGPKNGPLWELKKRIAELEAEVAALRARLKERQA